MAKSTMGTVDKALSLLRFFSSQTPELGLSELARLAGFDKTTTLRCLTALERNGFVEQDIVSRRYRVGLSPIHLAQTREQSFPVESIIKPHLDDLATSTGETAHGTVIAGRNPVTVAISYPNRALYVHVHASSPLPWHATASGIAIAAHLPETEQNELLDRIELDQFTQRTPTSRAWVKEVWDSCRRLGLAHGKLTFEDDVIGTAAPMFGQSGVPIGSIAVAAVATRMTQEQQDKIDTELRTKSKAISAALGGDTSTQMGA